jgi:3-mercaptopropionate dioxygenase
MRERPISYQHIPNRYVSRDQKCRRLAGVGGSRVIDEQGRCNLADIARLRDFVADFTRLIDRTNGDEGKVLRAGRRLVADLIRVDDWLPAMFAQPRRSRYQQYLLHCDPLERFSVVSFVWDKGQLTPIHNHTVWGLIGILRGAELSTRFKAAGKTLLEEGVAERLEVGQVDAVSPTLGDIHRVSNALRNGTSISIHVYGANIGGVRRAAFSADGHARPFTSGYSNPLMCNLWDRSS